MDLKSQRRMAAQELGCGVNRVWIDPDRMEDVSDAVTRQDVRFLINASVIKAKQKQGISKARARYLQKQKRSSKRRGHGSRKGASNARTPRKRKWIKTIRPIRTRLRQLKTDGTIEVRTYRKFYNQANGGMFRDVGHMESQLRMGGYWKEVE